MKNQMNKLPVTGKINGMRLQEVIICKGCFQISKPLIYEIKPNEEGIIIVQCV